MVRNFLERLGGPVGAALTAVVGAGSVTAGFGALGLGRQESLSAASGILALGGVVLGIACRRTFERWTVPGPIALTVLGLACGAAASLVPALLAPQGFTPGAFGPWFVVALVAIGLAFGPQNRMLWWVPCGIGMGFAAWLGFAALPCSPDMAGYEPPPEGSDVTVDWSADGAAVSIVYPLDEPVVVTNGTISREDAGEARSRLERGSASCPDADGEERAAAEAVISGDRGQAIARSRLALQICEDPSYGRDVLGTSLLARGVTRMRSGSSREAIADLEEALGVLREGRDRARAHLALGRALESLDRVDEARPHFESAAELAPTHPAGRAASKSLTPP